MSKKLQLLISHSGGILTLERFQNKWHIMGKNADDLSVLPLLTSTNKKRLMGHIKQLGFKRIEDL